MFMCCRFYNYESSLRDCLHQKWTVERDKENPLTNAEFRSVSLGTKVEIIYSLCMYRLDADDVAESVKVWSCLPFLCHKYRALFASTLLGNLVWFCCNTCTS